MHNKVLRISIYIVILQLTFLFLEPKYRPCSAYCNRSIHTHPTPRVHPRTQCGHTSCTLITTNPRLNVEDLKKSSDVLVCFSVDERCAYTHTHQSHYRTNQVAVTFVSEDGVSNEPTLTQVVPRGFAVIGITLVSDQLFVARWPSQEQIEVYDADTLLFHRPLAIPGLSGRPGGLASCSANNCVFVSDFKLSTIYRVALSDDHKATLTSWPTDGQPSGLSVNSSRNLLVTCRGSALKIQEYTSLGSLIREICMPSNVTRPMHAVQLSEGRFAVANGGTLPGQFGFRPQEMHRVSVLDDSGSVVCSYGDTYGCGTGQLDEPMYLAVCRNGNILVAVKENHCILVLDPSLSTARQLALPVAGGIKGPISVCLDESVSRLYVGEGIGGRLLVFDNVTNIDVGLN